MAYFLKNTTLSEVETIPFITHESNKPFTALDELCDLILSRGGSISQKHAFKKGIPGDLIIDELEGKLFKVAKPKEIDLERFKTA